MIALTQTVFKKIDSKNHVNILDILISQLKPRAGILYLKRLNIILDEDSEKGFGLVSAIPSQHCRQLVIFVRSTPTSPYSTGTT